MSAARGTPLLPPGPLVAWIDGRAEVDGLDAVLHRIGWGGESGGGRRLRRWREEAQRVDAYAVIDALHMADVHLEDVYDPREHAAAFDALDMAESPMRVQQGGARSRIADEHVRAAHRLHVEGGMSVRELGRRLYVRLGYGSPHDCTQALLRGMRALGLPRRTQLEAARRALTTHGLSSRSDPSPELLALRREQRRERDGGFGLGARGCAPSAPARASSAAGRRGVGRSSARLTTLLWQSSERPIWPSCGRDGWRREGA